MAEPRPSCHRARLVRRDWTGRVRDLFGDPIRICSGSSNKRAIPDARSPREAREILRRIAALPSHVFWPDDIEIASNEHIAWERLGSHAQVTDAHLLALAIRRGGRLASFDRGLADLAPEGKAESVVMLGR